MDKGRKAYSDTRKVLCRDHAVTQIHMTFCRCQSFWDGSSKQDTKVDVFGIRNSLEEILTPLRDSRVEVL